MDVMHKLKCKTRSGSRLLTSHVRASERVYVCESYTYTQKTEDWKTQMADAGRLSPASFALTPSTARTASGVSMNVNIT